MAKDVEQVDGPADENESEILDDIVEDFTNRLRAGQHPAIEDYQNQHPELKDEIEDLLASVAMIEQLKTAALTPSPNRRSLNEVSKLAHIANYEIKREIGRGGMGVVFEAVHESLGRRVAIKVMPTPLVNSEKYIRRFKREAKAAAKLHHTNIVGVFAVGDGERFHYYVMDFVDGQGLNEVIRGLLIKKEKRAVETNGQSTTTGKDATVVDSKSRVGELDDPGSSPTNGRSNTAGTAPETQDHNDTARKRFDIRAPFSRFFNQSENDSGHFRWAARIGANLADALAYAHSANILHRDIKPSNMILDRKGTVWITDFGLAKEISEEINLTKTGDVIGTPQYLAPESLESKYDQRSEVYCLGLTLYELATLQPAYKSGSTAEVLRAITTTNPISPRKINRKIPIDLSTIIDKAIQRSPNARYQTAEEMKNDLLAFVQDRPISARPPSTVENVIKWYRRRPLEATLSMATASLVALVAILATVAQYDAKTQFALYKTQESILGIRTKEVERHAAIAEQQELEARTLSRRAVESFDEIFRKISTKGNPSGDKRDVDSFEAISGVDTFLTHQDSALLKEQLKFYEKSVELNSENESQSEESAHAMRRIANIHQLIGEDAKAEAAYKESITRYQSINQEIGFSRETVIDLVITSIELSHVVLKGDSPADAIEHIKSATSYLEQLSFDQLDDSSAIEMARTLDMMSANLTSLIRQAPPKAHPTLRSKATKFSQRAIELMNNSLDKSPLNPQPRFIRANCLCNLAVAIEHTDKRRSIESRNRAVADYETLIANDSKNPTYLARLAVACSLVPNLSSPETSFKQVARGLKILDELESEFPSSQDYKLLKSSLSTKLAGLLVGQKNLDEAADMLSQAIVEIERAGNNSKHSRTLRRIANPIHQQCVSLAKAARESNNDVIAERADEMAIYVQTSFATDQ